MLVYDITDLESFQNLNSWLIEIEKNASKNVYKILVGNKCDMESERKIQKYYIILLQRSTGNYVSI